MLLVSSFFMADSFRLHCRMRLRFADGTRRRCSLESALPAMPLSGVRVFQRITSLPGPMRIPANLLCRRPGPDDFRFISPSGASIPESNDIIPNNRRWLGNIIAAADLPRRAGIREEGDMV
jgi:hypothetical protein